ncbi:hypothetical protein GCM10023074_18760 [Microbispora amethystogenes]|uniref:Uncharacterized protein n=1 Tax=Microbispora amethystogenes TaxID=1427754 RepID=A0ABQ4FLM2_9ACTN|nr:hypothetical protein Mam01_58750 [Microbispora amethystogenes]
MRWWSDLKVRALTMAARAVPAGRRAAASALRYASGVIAAGSVEEAAADVPAVSPEAFPPVPPGCAVQAASAQVAASAATTPGTGRVKVRGKITRDTVGLSAGPVNAIQDIGRQPRPTPPARQREGGGPRCGSAALTCPNGPAR